MVSGEIYGVSLYDFLIISYTSGVYEQQILGGFLYLDNNLSELLSLRFQRLRVML